MRTKKVKHIDNISVAQYLQLADVGMYDVLDLLPSNDLFAGKHADINAMSWINVKYCLKLINKINDFESLYDLFRVCYDIDRPTFLNEGVREYVQAKNYLIEGFTEIIRRESKVFAGKGQEDSAWVMAGGDKLSRYSDTLPLLNLGKMLGVYPPDLGRKPYREILGLLMQHKLQVEVETEYQRIKK